VVSLRINFDHVVPFAYSQNNYRHNFVAACHICNSIKSSMMFNTLDEARAYIVATWVVKGIRDDLPEAEIAAR